MKPFLTAIWSDILIFNYAVSEATVSPLLPPHLQPERDSEGRYYVCLIALQSSQTRIKGLSLPGLRDYPEIGLRLYARQADRRGLLSIKEVLPNPALAGAARMTHGGEHTMARITHTVSEYQNRRDLAYQITHQDLAHRILTAVDPNPVTPDELTSWLLLRPWGFAAGRPLRFPIQHPQWRVYPVQGYEVDVDFKLLFGERWHFLRGRAPDSIIAAEGSPVTLGANEKAA